MNRSGMSVVEVSVAGALLALTLQASSSMLGQMLRQTGSLNNRGAWSGFMQDARAVLANPDSCARSFSGVRLPNPEARTLALQRYDGTEIVGEGDIRDGVRVTRLALAPTPPAPFNGRALGELVVEGVKVGDPNKTFRHSFWVNLQTNVAGDVVSCSDSEPNTQATFLVSQGFQELRPSAEGTANKLLGTSPLVYRPRGNVALFTRTRLGARGAGVFGALHVAVRDAETGQWIVPPPAGNSCVPAGLSSGPALGSMRTLLVKGGAADWEIYKGDGLFVLPDRAGRNLEFHFYLVAGKGGAYDISRCAPGDFAAGDAVVAGTLVISLFDETGAHLSLTGSL